MRERESNLIKDIKFNSLLSLTNTDIIPSVSVSVTHWSSHTQVSVNQNHM